MIEFEKPGKENTDAVLRCVKEAAEALNIKTCVLATTRGYTGERTAGVIS